MQVQNQFWQFKKLSWWHNNHHNDIYNSVQIMVTLMVQCSHREKMKIGQRQRLMCGAAGRDYIHLSLQHKNVITLYEYGNTKSHQ
jgi:hypothetical protein